MEGEISTAVEANRKPVEEIVKKLYLKYDTTDETIHSKILSTIRNYPGTSPIIIKCTGTDKTFKLNLKVNPNDYFLNELNSILEESNIKLI